MHGADAIAKGETLAGFENGIGHKGTDNIIRCFILGGEFDQFNTAIAPIMRGLDPIRGPLFISQLHIGIMLRVAITLHQAKTFQARDREMLDFLNLRIF